MTRILIGPNASQARRLAAAAGITAGVVAASTWAGRDQSADLSASLAQLPWQVLGCAAFLLLVTVAHYMCAGAALRGVSNRALPWREAGLVQLAAAVANRVVPSGLGGAAVSGRYLLRSGLAPGATASALGALAAVGALSDGAYVAAVTTAGPTVGVRGASAELKTLIGHSAASGRQHWWVAAAVVVVIITFFLTRLRGRLIRSAVTAVRHAARHLATLVRAPGRVAGAAAASMTTTAVLGVGFVAAVTVWGHAPKPLPVGALMALYWVAAAAGNATPLPAFLGVTEAALVGGLVLASYSSTSAIVAVVIFRLVTIWLPLPVGIWATRSLRRAQLL